MSKDSFVLINKQGIVCDRKIMKTWFWIISWSLSILAITGNGFIIFLVWSKRQLRTKTNAFIVSLAVADFCVGMSAVPSQFMCEMEKNGCKLSSNLYSFVWAARSLFAYASVTNLCCLVLDRYIAVVKPLKYLTFMKRRRVIQMVSASWAISFAVVTVHTMYKLFFKENSILFHFSICLVFITEFFPSVMLIFCFVSMFRVVIKHNRAARSLAKQLHFNHRVFFKTHEKSAIIMMGIVISLFLVCYGIHIRCTVIFLYHSKYVCKDVFYKIPVLVLNSAINPLAYSFFKRDINEEFKRRLCFAVLIRR